MEISIYKKIPIMFYANFAEEKLRSSRIKQNPVYIECDVLGCLKLSLELQQLVQITWRKWKRKKTKRIKFIWEKGEVNIPEGKKKDIQEVE